MFKEEEVVKQLFNLNYKKQKQLEHLENKHKNLKYHNKYLRADVKTITSKYNSSLRYIKKYDTAIEQIQKIFKLDKQLLNDILEDEGILNTNFITLIKDL